MEDSHLVQRALAPISCTLCLGGSLKKRSNPEGMPARILVMEGWT